MFSSQTEGKSKSMGRGEGGLLKFCLVYFNLSTNYEFIRLQTEMFTIPYFSVGKFKIVSTIFRKRIRNCIHEMKREVGPAPLEGYAKKKQWYLSLSNGYAL